MLLVLEFPKRLCREIIFTWHFWPLVQCH